MNLKLLAATSLSVFGMFLSDGYFSTAIADTIKIEESKALAEPIETSVANGQASPIVFKNGQTINFVLLPDQSQSVFTPNAPIEEGRATALYLRRIEKLDIPGTTETTRPNLLVETLDSEGNRYEYEFILNVDGSAVERDKIVIIPTPPKPAPKPAPKPEPKIINTIETTYGSATPEDVRLGLKKSIQSGQISSTGTLAFSVNEYIVRTLNGTSAKDAIDNLKLPITVIEKLGMIGQQEDARRRILPLSPKFMDEN